MHDLSDVTLKGKIEKTYELMKGVLLVRSKKVKKQETKRIGAVVRQLDEEIGTKEAVSPPGLSRDETVIKTLIRKEDMNRINPVVSSYAR